MGQGDPRRGVDCTRWGAKYGAHSCRPDERPLRLLPCMLTCCIGRTLGMACTASALVRYRSALGRWPPISPPATSHWLT